MIKVSKMSLMSKQTKVLNLVSTVKNKNINKKHYIGQIFQKCSRLSQEQNSISPRADLQTLL